MPLKFKAQADGGLEIEIYDVIGLWGMTVADIAAKLKAVKGKDVTLRINSPGGSVTEGFAIYNVIKRHDGMVTAHIDGVAASMAGVVAMAAKKIIMPENSFMMIHNPTASMDGTSEELRQTADVLDKMGEMLINAYTRGGKVGRKMIEDMITGDSSTEEHWLTGAECCDMGLCDECVDSVDAAALSAHAAYFPKHQFTAQADTLPPVIPAGGQQKQPNMKKILTVLGLNESASEDAGAAEAQNLKNRVATLEQEKSTTVTAHAKAVKDAKDAALQEATTAVTTAENKRKADIKAFADKYDKDGDLNAATVTALSGTTTLEAFKDIVLDIIAKRPGKGAQKPAGENDNDDEITAFIKAYKTADDRGRRELIRKDRALSRRALRAMQAQDSE
jgi:ATP-dependent protease ClpP protease subunit